jgi:hypothetical protein
MTTPPSRESPGGTVVVRIERLPGADPNSATYSVSFTAKTAMGAVLLGRVQGLDGLRELLRKLNMSGPAVETTCSTLTDRPFHEIHGVNLTPALIRELGL